MSRGRSAVSAVALVAVISLLGACSSADSGAETAAADRRSAAAIRAATAKNRVRVAQRRAAARRRAALPKKPVAFTPTTIANTSPSADLAAIRRTVNTLNAAFNVSVADGITNATTANFRVLAGVYTRGQCVAYQRARGQGIVSEHIELHGDTLTPVPGWVDPVIGRVPTGRIYQVMITEVQTLVPTGQQRAHTLPVHVTVQPDGRGRLFLRCH